VGRPSFLLGEFVELWISAETGADDGFIRSAAAEEMTPWRAVAESVGLRWGGRYNEGGKCH